jgi:hypothetical protein
VAIVRGLCETFELDAEAMTPGRAVVRHIGQSLAKAMEIALQAGPPERIEVASKALKREGAQALKEAYEQVEEQVKTAIGAARAKQARREMLEEPGAVVMPRLYRVYRVIGSWWQV